MLNDEIEGVKRRQGGAGAAGGGGGKLGVLVVGLVVGLIGGALLMVLTPLGARLHPAPEARERVVEVPGETPEPEVRVVEKIVEKRVEVPVPAEPPAMPTRPVSYDPNIEISELFNGIQIRSELVSEEGGIASIEREQGGAFEAKFELRLTVPSATRELNDLAASNEHLPKLLTEMPSLLEGSEVSPYFFHLYDLKQRQVQSSLTRLQNALSRHNFYDCETALELTHDASGRRMFYLQGEMDVVSDGSDGDRMPQMSPEIYESPHYQALTSYGWPKKTRQPNPLLKVTEAKLEKYKERYKVVGLTRRENQFLESQIEYLPRVIQDLKSRSFLLAEADPFIVITLSMRDYKGKDPFIPGVGDYAVVIHEDKLYPAIVGE